jgi:hypothetical protein
MCECVIVDITVFVILMTFSVSHAVTKVAVDGGVVSGGADGQV